ncbi:MULTISPECIES: alpha/beta hydrolase [unclassified Beijerinckia]|uniref:alpha/beta hydrolase n=1 Tax=unclassified Beijerinckia TaxID=2638183 RepID=UPI0008965F6D|nr:MULTISPECIES: alpha/beta hydrolase [unclassified Beijerinckia]MDH7799234.1 arylformamidase [Beijerinckia sp. GAS462]SED91184.1 alpha/beta hydrolase fold [Beijerinckia sp. 28-YEA-48]
MNWELMSGEERNLAYNNTAHVGAEFVALENKRLEVSSGALRSQYSQHLDLIYKNSERTKWDLYPGFDPNAPCLVHIHGGYWQRGSKELFACVAEGALARGWSAALPGYTLAPQVSLTRITEELRTAFDWLSANAARHGIAGPVIVTGWSAGGHLAAYLLDHPRIAAGLAISGVYDLAHLQGSPHVNDKVMLTDVEVEFLSPKRLSPANKAFSIAYGTNELPAMIASSRDYHAYRAEKHLGGQLVPICNANHYTVLEGLRSPNSLLMRQIADLLV